MKRFAFGAVAAALCCAALQAAPVDERIRGQIVSVSPGTLVVRTSDGTTVSLVLNQETRYVQVVPTSLDKLELGRYIGTATKDVGSIQVALEVTIFPASMRGLKPGHFPYDQLPDTTLSGATTESMMTNGDLDALEVPPAESVGTTETIGKVAAAAQHSGGRQLRVTYKGGQQTILVPPTAPVVSLNPADRSDLSEGAYVFVDAVRDGSSLSAGLVAAGVGELRPPF